MKKTLMLSCVLALGLVALPTQARDAAMLEQLEQMRAFMDLMQDYYALIDVTHAIAADPDKAAILKMQKIQEIYKERGDHAEAIELLTDLANNAKSPTVRSAAAVLLADTLKESGRASQAIEVLRQSLEGHVK